MRLRCRKGAELHARQRTEIGAVVAELDDDVLLLSPGACRIHPDGDVQRHVTPDDNSTVLLQIPKPEV